VGERLLEDVIKLIQTGTAVTIGVGTENVYRQRISQLNIQQATCHFEQKNISHV
jgi:fumarate hydratase class II